MTLEKFNQSKLQNKFCKLANLRNESDVEQFFVIRLLNDLGYEDERIETKTTIHEEAIGKGRRKKSYKPDYIVYLDKERKKPSLIIDAKHPNEDAEEGIADSQLYASVLRRKLSEPKPQQYCVGTNGLRFVVKHYDSDQPKHSLAFSDFIDGNPKYETLKKTLTPEALRESATPTNTFQLEKPEIRDILGIFEAAHNTIWKTEKRSPTSAFYEFAKIMFVKLNEDKKLRKNGMLRQRIDAGEPIPQEDVIFSTHWIEHEERTDPNPIDSILFKNLREFLEAEIVGRRKKRIFDEAEKIELEPSTIKEVVKLLEHYDLYGIDEDLNGKLFETFLNATMRGKELGQFFTPRSVVDFMTKLADLQIEKRKESIPKILDGCCGTAGFLIEAMADLSEKVGRNKSLTNEEQEELLEYIRNECLWGCDAGKSPPIARIARINMFLHGDGGSKIYFADSLDKELKIETGIDKELRRDREELRKAILDKKLLFGVVLTNPPFAMTYQVQNPKEKRILEQYALAYEEVDRVRHLKPSLRSSIMFLERYYELLEPHGKLLTIIDESILNTDTNKPIRDWLKEKFIIKAVISLPKNTFVNAESGVKTSVLYLIKKQSKSEKQPSTFMAISGNVGHNDSGRATPLDNDLPSILETFREFERGNIQPRPVVQETEFDGGTPVQSALDASKASLITNSPVYAFCTNLTDSRRLDCEFNHPRHLLLENEMTRLSKNAGLKLQKIGELAKTEGWQIRRGKSSRVYVSEGIPIIKIVNITNEGLNWNKDFVALPFYEENPDQHLRKDDVILCCTGFGSVGKVDILNDDWKCMTVPENVFIRTGDPVKSLYLLYFLRSRFGQTQIEKLTSGGTGQLHFYPDDLANLDFLMPTDTAKQEMIVKRLEEKEQQAIERLAVARELETKFESAVLDGLNVKFGKLQLFNTFPVVGEALDNRTARLDVEYFDPRYEEAIAILKELRKRAGIKVSRLGKLLGDSKHCLTGGETPKGAIYPLEGIYFIRVQNVKKGRLDLAEAKFIERRIHEGKLRRSKLKPDDVLLTITGYTYGQSAVVPRELTEANINQHVVRIEVNRSQIDPYYLSCFLNSELCKRQMDRAVTGGTRPALDYDAIKSLLIAYPSSLPAQEAIAGHCLRFLDDAIKKREESRQLRKAAYVEFERMLEDNTPLT